MNHANIPEIFDMPPGINSSKVQGNISDHYLNNVVFVSNERVSGFARLGFVDLLVIQTWQKNI